MTYPVDPYFTTGTISPNAEQRNRKDTYVEQWTSPCNGSFLLIS